MYPDRIEQNNGYGHVYGCTPVRNGFSAEFQDGQRLDSKASETVKVVDHRLKAEEAEDESVKDSGGHCLVVKEWKWARVDGRVAKVDIRWRIDSAYGSEIYALKLVSWTELSSPRCQSRLRMSCLINVRYSPASAVNVLVREYLIRMERKYWLSPEAVES